MLKNLGKFTILSELGHGAMGVVYRAEDNLGRSVALKVLPARFAGDSELVERFNREARSAAGLKHPNIVVIYESAVIDETSFIAMEYIEGETLEQMISSRKPVPIVQKLDIIIQSCRGLHYAHKRQIVHRDVKPSNIMVELDGSVKIVDFGIAHLGLGATLTLGGQILGTPMYMSPEQTLGKTLDARSDVFSIGVVLFELLTYQKPFTGNEIAAVWYKIQHDQPPPLSDLIPRCPPELQKVVSKALAKNRDERYQTADDLGFALQQVSDYFKHEMIEVYVQEGRRYLDEGNLTIAKESIQRALEIDSSHDVARSLFDQVEKRIASRRLAQRVEQLLRQAKEALQENAFDQGITLLDEILQLDPAHQKAQQYRTLAVERRDRAREISQRMERAEKLATDADLEGVKREVEAVLALDRNHSAAQRMLDWVLKELTAQERQRQVQRHTQEARNHIAQKNFDQARDLLEKAQALDPINIEVEALLRQVHSDQEREKERLRREGRLSSIQGALNTQNFDKAVTLAEQVLEEFPGDSMVLKLHAQATRLAELENRRRDVEEQLQLARSFFQKDQYAEAVSVLQRALERVPNDARLTSYLKTVQEAQKQSAAEGVRREAIRKASALIREKKLASAISTLEEALNRVGESPETLDLLQFAREQQIEQQKEERVRQVLNWAQICLREQNFEEAARVLELARRESPSNDIEALLASAREQQQQFEKQGMELMQQARRSLEAGDAAGAVAQLKGAPVAHFKNEAFRQLYAQCREGFDRANSIRLAMAELEKAEADGDPELAGKLLDQALQNYPNEAALLAARERLRARKLRLRRDEWRKLIDEAKVAVGHTEYERAVRILTSLPAELSQAPELKSEAEALLKEAQQRAHELALRQQAIQAANEAIRNSQFGKAIVLLEKASAEAGHSPDVADLLRFAREQRDERVRKALKEAQTQLHSDVYEGALATLEQAQKETDANEVTALLASAREQQQKFDARRQEISQQARQLLNAGDAVKAVALLDAAPKAFLKSEDYQRLYAQCREGLDRASFISSTLAQIETCLESQDLVHADTALRQGLRQYPKEPALLAVETRLRKEQSRLQRMEWTKRVEEAKAAASRGDHAHALEILKSLPPEIAEQPDLASEARALQEQVSQSERQLATRQQALREAKEYISGNDFSAAIEVLEKAAAVEVPSPELADLLQYARERKTEQDRQGMVRQVLSQVNQLAQDYNYEDAVRILEQAKGELGGAEIGALLQTTREQQRQFEERRKETLARVRQLLEAGEAAKAQAVLDAAPKTYFKRKEFSQIYAECTAKVARSDFVRSTLEQFEEYLGAQDFPQAEALLQRASQTYPYDPALLAAQKRFEDARLRRREAQWRKVVDEAKVALGRSAYQQTRDLLVALPQEIAAIPELATEVAALLDEARQSEQRLSVSLEAIRVAREQLQAEQYPRAIETLEKALAIAGQSAELADLLKFARAKQTEQLRQESIRRVLDEAHKLQRDDNYEDAVSVLERAKTELGSDDIDKLLLTAREQGQRFKQRRTQTLERARKWLESGEAAKAVAVLDAAPKSYFKDEEFRRFSSECKGKLERADFIRNALGQFRACLRAEDFSQAEAVLEQGFAAYPEDPALLAARTQLREERLRWARAVGRKGLDQAKISLGRRQYQQAVQLLSALPPEVVELPEFASEVAALLEEGRRGEKELAQRQTIISKPRTAPKKLKAEDQRPVPRAVWWAATVAAVVLAIALMVLLRPHAAKTGYAVLNPIPWATVVSVQSGGKDATINVTLPATTPLRVALPPGEYEIGYKTQQGDAGVGKLTVTPGGTSVWHDRIGGFDADKAVDELVK
jgi:serine/threonine-protein kinase